MGEDKKPRRRPGRFRRWIVRPFVWGLFAIVVAFVVLLRFLESAAFAEKVRIYAQRTLTDSLEREVEIGSLELDLMPLTAEIEDFRIHGPSSGSEPFLSVGRAVIEAELGAFFGRRLELSHVHVTEPRLWLGFDDEGRAETPRFGRGGGGARAVELRFGTIEIVRGEFILDEDRMPVDFTARDLEAVFTGVADGVELRGRAESDDFGLRLPPGVPYAGRIEIHGLIRRHRFDIVRAELSGPDLEARGDGYWRWQGDRELALEIDAEGDLAALGRLGYLPGQLTGPFDFDGSLVRKPGVLLVDGDVRSARARVFDRAVGGLEARLHADANGLSVDIERALYGAGGVSGRITLGLAVDPGRVDLALKLDRVRLARLLADQAIPLTGLSGGVSGVFNYQFDSARPEAGNGWADLLVTDERAPDPEEIPVTGTIPLVIGDGLIRANGARLSSREFLLTAAGSYDLGRATGAYDFELSATDVAQVIRLVPGEREEGPAGAWRPTAGSGTATGRLSITESGTSTRLRLDLASVEAAGFRADELSGVVAIDGGGVRELRLELVRPDAALLVTGAVPFAEPAQEVEPFPFLLAVDAAGWPLEETRVWLPFELPAEGRYSGVVELMADPESVDGELAGRMDGRLAPARWGDLEAESLDVVARFDRDEMRIESADLSVSGGKVSTSGSVRRADLGLDLAFRSTPLDLERGQLVDRLGVRIAGSLTAAGRISGTFEQPDVEARLSWSDLRLGELEPGEAEAAAVAEVDVEWRDGRLRTSGSLLGLASIEGGGELRPERVELDFELEDGRLDRVARLLAPAVELEGAFGGRLRVTGSYSPPGELGGVLELDRLTVRPTTAGLENGSPLLTNLEPVVLELGAEGLRLRSLYLGDEGGSSEVFVGGRVGSGGELDLQLQTSIASEWLALALARAWPDARWSGGAFEAIATIEGDTTQPRVNGVGEVRGARLVAEALPTAIEDLSGTLLFYRDQLVVDSVTARVAGGSVRAGGVVSLAGEEAGSYRLQATGERLSYRSPLGWTARGGSELTLASTPEGRLLSGVVTLDQAVYVEDVPVGLDQLLGAVFGSERLEVAPAADEWRASTQLNLRLDGDRALRVRNNLADLRGSAELVLRGSLARPVVFGAVEVEPGGRLAYGGADYRVERGQLSFTNPYRIEPVIDLAARTELRQYDVTLNLSGTPDRLSIDLASNPPLADLDVLALLTGAQEAPGAGSDRGEGSGVGAESFLYGQATSLIAQRFNRLFGLDKFRIDPLTSATGSLSSARVTVGKRLSRDFAVTYSYDPSATEEQVLELEWSVSRSLVLVLTQNGDGTYALDARWEKAL